MEEMSRCIHCTRCVRFGQEIAGVMELGMLNRGEHSEITTFVGRSVDSELSGNMIDICPVGALTSKPFRYSARTWELARRKSVSPHDSTGANLIVQVKGSKVMRVVPLENDDVNECWIADRDRFSYEALNSPQRLTQPMVRQGGHWRPTDWSTALEVVASGLRRVRQEHGAAAIGALGSPHATCEELHLLGRLVRGMGSENVDHRLRHADFRRDGAACGTARWLGMPVAALSNLQSALVVGSFLRKDHPLFAQRLRQAARRGARIASLHAVHDDWLMPLAQRMTAAPGHWLQSLADIAAAVAAQAGVAAPLPGTASEAAQAVAATLASGERRAILLGNAVAQHPQAQDLLALANWIAAQTGAQCGFLSEAANSVGAQLVGALPGPGGLDASAMLAQPRKGLLLLNVEPVLDMADPQAAHAALAAADLVVALTPFKDAAVDGAHVLLPIAPFSETGGTFVNAEGRVQGFVGVVPPLGEARPAWKVLRVLGNLLGLEGFDHETVDAVRAEALGDLAAVPGRLSNAVDVGPQAPGPVAGLQRLADVPIYAADALVRRAAALQQTADARPPVASLPDGLWQSLGLRDGDRVRIAQGAGWVVLPARRDPTLAPGTVRVPAGHPDTAGLGAMAGTLHVERVTLAEGVEA
jgi:NADH-quinone oxidoreductase subunit G